MYILFLHKMKKKMMNLRLGVLKSSLTEWAFQNEA